MWEIRPFKKFPGGWSGLELTDTLDGAYDFIDQKKAGSWLFVLYNEVVYKIQK